MFLIYVIVVANKCINVFSSQFLVLVFILVEREEV